jgi:hypothetical protein
MIRRHLLDGDGKGNKLEAVIKNGYVDLVNITITENERGMDVHNRHLARISVPTYLALADVIRMEEK